MTHDLLLPHRDDLLVFLGPHGERFFTLKAAKTESKYESEKSVILARNCKRRQNSGFTSTFRIFGL